MAPDPQPSAPPSEVERHDMVRDGHWVAPAAAGGPNTHYTDEAYKLAYKVCKATNLLASGVFRNDPAGMGAAAPRFVTSRRQPPFILLAMGTITNSSGRMSHHRLIQLTR